MAKVKFQSRVASVSNEKCDDAFIDSGATHHFFHDKSSFLTYDKMKYEPVKAASGTSKLVGKGFVKLPIDQGLIVEAYYASNFSANIISVRLLLKVYKIEFSEDANGLAFCTIIRKSSMNEVARIVEEDLLFPVKLNKNQKTFAARIHKSNLLKIGIARLYLNLIELNFKNCNAYLVILRNCTELQSEGQPG